MQEAARLDFHNMYSGGIDPDAVLHFRSCELATRKKHIQCQEQFIRSRFVRPSTELAMPVDSGFAHGFP